MNGDMILDFELPVPSFPIEMRRVRTQASCTIRLSNRTQDHVAFMVITSNPLNYGCQPSLGIIPPTSTQDLTVTMRGFEDAPTNIHSHQDMFLVRSLVVSSNMTIEDIEILFDEVGDLSQNGLLRADYIFSPHLPSSLPNGLIRGVIVALLAIILWYLVKKIFSLIGSSITFIAVLVVKIISQSLSDSIKDWILTSIRDIFLDPLYRRLHSFLYGPNRHRPR